MPIKKVLHDKDSCAPVKVWTNEVEGSALDQLYSLSELPFIHKHIAVMPDVHAGIGSTVGSVIPTIKAIIPAAVGVDIGCGMVAAQLSLKATDLPDSLAAIRSAIEAAVPHGRSDNGGPNDKGSWGTVPKVNEWFRFRNEPDCYGDGDTLGHRLFWIAQKHSAIERAAQRAANQLGTLGTGNHFIELCLDTEDNVWVMLHSGSRGIGNKIGSYFIEKAKEQMERWHVSLPHQDLAFLPEGESLFDDYVEAVSWAQDYARSNRSLMLDATLRALHGHIPSFKVVNTAINCHHNYVEMENHFGKNVWVTRKGAVRARVGDLGIIPGSMGAKSFIVRGKGNPESFCSCSHGAGRTMSRAKARETFNTDDLAKQTAGVECRKDLDVIDEIPGAYKDIDEVMQNQSDLVEVVATLKQIVCVKG